jgi:hypothetical protein
MMKTQISLMALIGVMISLAQPVWAMEEQEKGSAPAIKSTSSSSIEIAPLDLGESWDGKVAAIGEWIPLFTNQRPEGKWHPARLWILESTSDHPELPIQVVFCSKVGGEYKTASFGRRTIEGKQIIAKDCSFKGEEGSPGESEKYINNHYDEAHRGRVSTTGKQFNVWGRKKDFPTAPRETLDKFPESATLIFTPTPSTSD